MADGRVPGSGEAGRVKPGPVVRVLGAILVGVGIVGLFLPVLQGIAMIVIGLTLMGEDRIIHWAKRRIAAWRAKRSGAGPDVTSSGE